MNSRYNYSNHFHTVFSIFGGKQKSFYSKSGFGKSLVIKDEKEFILTDAGIRSILGDIEE